MAALSSSPQVTLSPLQLQEYQRSLRDLRTCLKEFRSDLASHFNSRRRRLRCQGPAHERNLNDVPAVVPQKVIAAAVDDTSRISEDITQQDKTPHPNKLKNEFGLEIKSSQHSRISEETPSSNITSNEEVIGMHGISREQKQSDTPLEPIEDPLLATPTEETLIPVPLTPGSRQELSAEINLLAGEIARFSSSPHEDITPKLPPSRRIGISGVGRLEIASPVSFKGKKTEFDSFKDFGGKDELCALIFEYSKTEVPDVCPESIQDIWLNTIDADMAQIGVMYLPAKSTGTHRMEHLQFCLKKEKTDSATQERWRVERMLPTNTEVSGLGSGPKEQGQTQSPSKSPKRKPPPPLQDTLASEGPVGESLAEGDDDGDASSLAEAIKHCIEITDAARTPRALFSNFDTIGASSNFMISRESFSQLVAMYGGRSPAAAGGEKLAGELFESLAVLSSDGTTAVPYDIFCAEFCPTRAHDAVLRLQSKRNSLIRDLQAAVSASCLPSTCVISGIVGETALDEGRFKDLVSKMLSDSQQPQADPVAAKSLWCELVRGQAKEVRVVTPRQLSELLSGESTSLSTGLARSSPRVVPAPLDVALAADDGTVVRAFGMTDGLTNSHDVAPHFVLRDAMRFGATLDSRSPRDLFDTVSTSAGGAGSALTISRDDFVSFAARLGGGNALHAPAPSLDVGSVSTDSSSHLLFEYLAIKDAHGDFGVHYEIFVTQICPEGAPDVVAKSTKMQKALLSDLRTAVRSASREPEMRVETLVGEGPLDEHMFNKVIRKILETKATSSSHGPVALKLTWLHFVRDRLQPDCRLNSHELIAMLTARDPTLAHSTSLELSDDDSSMELGQSGADMVLDVSDITPFTTPQHKSLAQATNSRDFISSLETAVVEASEAEQADTPQAKVKLSKGSQMAGLKYKGDAMRLRKMERSVRLVERQYGSSHPEVAHALLGLASQHEKQGSHGDQKAHLDRAMSIYAQSSESDKVSLIDGLSKHVGIARERGDAYMEELLLKRIQLVEDHDRSKDIAGLSGDRYDRCGIRQRNKDRVKQAAESGIHSPAMSNLSASMLLSDATAPCGVSATLKDALTAGLLSPTSENSLVVKPHATPAPEPQEPLQCTARHHIGQNIATITADRGICMERVLEASAFKEWVGGVAKEPRFEVSKIHIDSVDMFGAKVGFIKFTADVKVNSERIPGIVFMRGGAVAVLVILCHEGQEFVLVVRQPRVAVPFGSIAEIPVGMLDGGGNFAGVAAKEMKEEAGIDIKESDLIDMTRLAYQEKYPGMYASCGGSDEFNRIFLYQKTITAKELENFKGKLTGVAEEGEMIKLQIVPFDTLWRKSPDAKILAALALHARLRRGGLIPDLHKSASLAVASGEWSSERSIDLCGTGEEELFQDKVALLDKNLASSVTSAIESLNHGLIKCEVGYCIVLDDAAGKYFLIYRSGKRETALACFGLKDSPKGTICVTVYGATNLKNVDTGIFGDVSDPFLVARISLEEQRTETINNNLNPIWRKNLFEYHDKDLSREDEQKLFLEVFDSGNLRNKSLGTAVVDLSSLEPDVTAKLTLVLQNGGGSELSLSVKFSPEQIEIPVTEIRTSQPAEAPKNCETPPQLGDPSGLIKRKLVGVSPLFRASDLQKVFTDADVDKDGVLGQADLNTYFCDYLGYGRAEIEAFRREFGDQHGVNLEGLQRGVKALSPYSIKQASGRLFVRKPGAFGGHDGIALALEDLTDCTVLICDRTCQITADQLTNCRVLLGTCSDAIFLRNCQNCTFWTACRQFRTRECQNCDFYLHCGTEPVIEMSKDLRFAPFAAEYPGLTKQFEDAKLVAAKNFWSAIFDFSRKTASDPTNWTILALGDCESLVVSWGNAESPDSPSPSLTQDLLVAEPLVSEESHGQSVASIPQRRPSPPAQTHSTCRVRRVTDEADSLREGAIIQESISGQAPPTRTDEAIASGNSEFVPVELPAVVCPESSKSLVSNNCNDDDDDIEIEILDEGDSSKSASGLSAVRNALSKADDEDEDDDDVQARHSPTRRRHKQMSTLAKMAAGADDDSDDDILPLGRIPVRSAVSQAKSLPNSSLLKKAIGRQDDSDDSDELRLPMKPGVTVKNAMASWLKTGQRKDSDTSDSDGVDTRKGSVAARRAER